MNAKTISTFRSHSHFFNLGQRILNHPRCLLILAALLLPSACIRAVNLSWDANSVGAANDGSGTWYASNVWYNGTNDVPWTNGATNSIGTTNVPGAYTINLDSNATVGVITFRSNNYTISGSSTLTYNSLVLAPGAVSTVSVPLVTPNGGGMAVSNGATLTLGGGFASLGGNPNFNGTNPTNSFLVMTNGTYTAAGTETYNNITATQTGGAVAFGIWNIGRTAAATYNLNGGTLRNTTVNAFSISRGFPGVVNVNGTGLLGGVGNLSIAGNTGTDNGTLNVLGGTVNVGTGIGGTPGLTAASLANINMISLGAAGTYSTSNNGAALNISGGVVTAKGIQFGSSVSSYVNHPFCRVTMTGGSLYLDANGMAYGSGVTTLTNVAVTLSGGTLAATANWTGSIPMSLTNVNGNLTLQAADTNTAQFNVSLTGGLSGSGGLNKTGNGSLTLSGGNTYAGATVVSNGQFAIRTGGPNSIGPVTLNSSTALSSVLSATGQSWTNAGLSITSGVTVDFNFAGFQASPVSRVIQVNGDFAFDTGDSFTIEGSALLVGTYPLVTCTGTMTLNGGPNLPNIVSFPSGVSGYLTNNANTLSLVVTASPNVFLQWGPLAAGPWDFTTADWINSGSGNPTNYSDGLAVTLNDNSNSAVAITLNTTVQPASITANNSSGGTAYTIAGTGAISGNASVVLQGTGTLALGASNTYYGGTTVNSGTLAINNGGDGFSASAVGVGILTLNPGAALDNTSGSNVVLNTPITEYWNGSFSYAGSTGNLDLGPGSVVLQVSPITIAVNANMLTCSGLIADYGANVQLNVQGPGALTLSAANAYTGGTVLNSGKLNINNGGDGNSDSAIGTGTLFVNGGVIDNTSGSPVQLQSSITEAWNADFAFAGTGNLDLGAGTLNISAITLTLQGGVLRSTGSLTAVGAGAVAALTLAGNGVFQASGNRNDPGLTINVNNNVTFLMDKASSASVHSTGGGLNVNTGGLARITGTGGQQVINSTLGPVKLGGGTLDLNGSAEKMFSFNFTSGTLQNSSATAASLTMSTNFTLSGSACTFDIPSNSSSLTIPTPVVGTGSLIKIGDGTLNLTGTNGYTGSTTVSNGLLVITTATTASNRNYTVAGGELETMLDPGGVSLQMSMGNLALGAGVHLGFDLASGAFGDAILPVISAGPLAMSSNVVVDVFNAPADANNDVLLKYAGRTGPGLFVAGALPSGAFLYDNTIAHTVVLTYSQPPPPAPNFTSANSVISGGVVTGITFTGVHGPADSSFEIVSSTDVSLTPLSAWTPVQSGAFDDAGSFSVTISIAPGAPQKYYLLRVP